MLVRTLKVSPLIQAAPLISLMQYFASCTALLSLSEIFITSVLWGARCLKMIWSFNSKIDIKGKLWVQYKSGPNDRICGLMLIYHKHFLDSSLVSQNAVVRHLKWKWNLWSIFKRSYMNSYVKTFSFKTHSRKER